MKVLRADIYEIHVPMKLTFKHAGAARSEGSAVALRLETADGAVGWGECAPRPYVTAETTESVVEDLKKHLAPQLGTEFASFGQVLEFIDSYLDRLPRHNHAAFCAVELALLDLAGKIFEKSAGDVAGPLRHDSVLYSAVITAGDAEQAEKNCMLARKFGMKTAKMKVGLSAEQDVQLLRTVRQILGEDCGLRIDANFAWSAEEALSRIELFEEFNLQGVEQPLRADDLQGHIWLTERSPVPIIVDETLVSYEDAQMLAEKKACHMFNIRISKCGGLCNSARIRDFAEQAGLSCMMGAQVGETALLTAAGRHFATHSEDLKFLEGSFGQLLLKHDITEQDLTFGPGGRGDALSGHGLGVKVDETLLKQCVARHHELKAD